MNTLSNKCLTISYWMSKKMKRKRGELCCVGLKKCLKCTIYTPDNLSIKSLDLQIVLLDIAKCLNISSKSNCKICYLDSLSLDRTPPPPFPINVKQHNFRLLLDTCINEFFSLFLFLIFDQMVGLNTLYLVDLRKT